MYNLRARGPPSFGQNTSEDSDEVVVEKVAKKSLQVKKKTYKHKGLKCEFCERTCCSMSALKTHVRSHTGEKPFSCSDCKKEYTRVRSLRNHIQIHEKDKKSVTIGAVKNPYFCEHCFSIFTSKMELINHLRSFSCRKDLAGNESEKDLTGNESEKDLVGNESEKDLTGNESEKDLTENECEIKVEAE